MIQVVKQLSHRPHHTSQLPFNLLGRDRRPSYHSLNSFFPRPSPSRHNHPPQHLPLLLQNHQSRILNDLPLWRRNWHRTPRNLRRNHNSSTGHLRLLRPLPPLSKPRPPNNNPLGHDPVLGNLTPRTDLRVAPDLRVPVYGHECFDCGGGVDVCAGMDG